MFSGEMKKKLIISTATISTSTEAEFIVQEEINVGDVPVPILVFVVSSESLISGTISVEYGGRLNDFPLIDGSLKTANIEFTLHDGKNYGILEVTNFYYSMIYINKITNGTSELPDLNVYVCGVKR